MSAHHKFVFPLLLSLFWGAHLVAWLCTLVLARARRWRTRILLLALFLVLPFGFPAAWIWSMRSPGLLPRLLHAVLSLWLAILVNFVIALAATLMVWCPIALYRRRFKIRGPVLLAALVAGTATLYGIVNARFPRIHRVEVRIRNLPPQWEGRTIVQLSDVHLGLVQGPGFLDRVVRQVNALEPDLIAITGDLFDGLMPRSDIFVPGLSRLSGRHGVFFVTGNHEGYAGTEKVLGLLAGAKNIRVLDNEVVTIDGLQLAGASYPVYNRRPRHPPITARALRRDLPAILLFHTPTGLDTAYADRRTQQMATYFLPAPDFRAAREMGIDLQLSGHTHAGQTFPFGSLTRRLFKGYDRGLHTMGDFSLYVSAGTGTWGPPMRIGCNPEITLLTLRAK